MRGSGPRGDLVVKNSIEEVVHLSPSTFMEFDETTMSAQPGHPCDGTAVAVLLGTPTLSPTRRLEEIHEIITLLYPYGS